MTEIICAAMTAVSAIIVAIIGAKIKQNNDEHRRLADEQEKRVEENEARIERRAEIRKRESLLSLRMMNATLQLAIVNANALTGGHNNGNVERARLAAEEAAEEYQEFMQEMTAHQVSKQ